MRPALGHALVAAEEQPVAGRVIAARAARPGVVDPVAEQRRPRRHVLHAGQRTVEIFQQLLDVIGQGARIQLPRAQSADGVGENAGRADLPARRRPHRLIGFAVAEPRPAQHVPPIAFLELHMQQRVLAHRLFADRHLLALVEARGAVIDVRAQGGEGQRQHHVVGRDVLRAARRGKAQRVSAVGVARQTRETVVEMNVGAALPLRELADQAVRAARNAVAPVLVAERSRRSAARRAEGVDQIERALLVRFRAELVHVGDGEQASQARSGTARHVLLDPLRHAHVVERLRARRALVPPRRERRGGEIAHHLIADRQQILIHRRRGIGRVVDQIDRIAAREIEVAAFVAQRHAEVVREHADGGMPGLDEFAALFHVLTGKGGAVGDAASAQALRAVVHHRLQSRLAQQIGAGETRETCADDDDARRRLRKGGQPHRRDGEPGTGRDPLYEPPAGSQLGARGVEIRALTRAREFVQPDDLAQKRRMDHGGGWHVRSAHGVAAARDRTGHRHAWGCGACYRPASGGIRARVVPWARKRPNRLFWKAKTTAHPYQRPGCVRRRDAARAQRRCRCLPSGKALQTGPAEAEIRPPRAGGRARRRR